MKTLIKRYFLFLLSVLFIIYSISTYHLRLKISDKKYPYYHKQRARVYGVVDRIDKKKYGVEYLLKRANIIIKNKTIKCKKIILQSEEYNNELKIGRSIGVEGLITSYSKPSNPGEFNSYIHNFNNNIFYKIKKPKYIYINKNYNHIKNLINTIKIDIDKNLNKIDTSKERIVSNFIKAIFLSDKNSLPQDIKDMFRRNGISHILSISGLHIWVIGIGMYKIWVRLKVPNYLSTVISMIMLSFYIMLIGFSISSFRAYIMLIMMFIAKLIHRSYSVIIALSTAAIITLTMNIKHLFNIGFILSYFAVFVIIALVPHFTKIFKKENVFVRVGLVSSCIIHLSLMPVIAYFFYERTLYSILLNLVVIPMMLPLLLLSIISVIFAYICPFISGFAMNILGILLKILFSLCNFSDSLPYNCLSIGRPSVIQICIYYVVLILFLIAIKYIRLKKLAFIGFCSLLFFIIGYKNNKELCISVLNIGQGDCIVIENTNREVFVIDGGSTQRLDGGYRVINDFLKYKGYDKIDFHILTHSDTDHLSGMRQLILSDYKICNVILPLIKDKDKSYLNYEEVIKKHEIPINYIKRGDAIISNNLELKCLHPYYEFNYDKPNEYSTVLHLKYKDFDMLLTGDLEGRGEESVSNLSLPDIDVLKVAHHGSKYSTDNDFLSKVKAEYGIISCGLDNSYGHPHNELIKRLNDNNIKTYQTNKHGAVEIRTNGKQMKINYFKGYYNQYDRYYSYE